MTTPIHEATQDGEAPPPSGTVYGFEDCDEALSLIPFAARRALDLAGVKLSLEAWRGLARVQRARLVHAGTCAVVPLQTVRTIAQSALPTPAAMPPTPELDALAVPAVVARALGERWTADLWPRLTPLDRYVLHKLASPSSKSQSGDETGTRQDPRLHTAWQEMTKRWGDAAGAQMPIGATAGAQMPMAAQRTFAATPLTHLGQSGRLCMVDVSAKPLTERHAVARALVRMRTETLERVIRGDASKGDVLAAARLAAITVAKRTAELIPLCHTVALSHLDVDIVPAPDGSGLSIGVTARAVDRTGVEMEAMVGASAAALTIYDMLKAIDRDMSIAHLELVEKGGGRSGRWVRADA